MQKRKNAQSAMEYLMTYGWAILIISIVLASLWSLGVFSSTPTSGSGAACVGTVGYLCGTPVLESNGLLLTSIGQTSQRFGHYSYRSWMLQHFCTAFNFLFDKSHASTFAVCQRCVQLQFTCEHMGSPFFGTLWMQYNSGGATGLISG